MELYVALAAGLVLLLALGGRARPEPPQVIYVVERGRRGGGLISALLGLAIFVALALWVAANIG